MKRNIIILIAFIITLIMISLYFTYAIDVKVEKTTGTADLTYNINITDSDGKTVSVGANETKIFELNVTNNNGVPINYGIAYSPTLVENVKIAQLDSSKNKISGLMGNNATYQISIVIENKTSNNLTYTIIPVTGYEHGGNLIVPDGYTLITDIYNMFPKKASDYIISLSKGDTYVAGEGNGVYATNSYDDNGTTKYHDYRYVGGEVDNYVKFNDDLYRIIGVFDDNSHGVEGELLVKLIMANKLTSVNWGAYNSAASSYVSYAGYKNDWTGNTIGVPANANVLLNEFYYNPNAISSYGDCINWTYANNGGGKSNNCSNIKGYGIQSQNLRNYIEPVTWYLYGYIDSTLSKSDFYLCERNNYDGCTSANSGTYQGTANASIGLMYVSDYMYASGYFASNDNTNNKGAFFGALNWMYNGYEWTITPVGNLDNKVFDIYPVGGYIDYFDRTALGVRPVFYLRSNIKIKSGDGTFNNPYIIGL